MGLHRCPSVHPGPFGMDGMGAGRAREMHRLCRCDNGEQFCEYRGGCGYGLDACL